MSLTVNRKSSPIGKTGGEKRDQKTPESFLFENNPNWPQIDSAQFKPHLAPCLQTVVFFINIIIRSIQCAVLQKIVFLPFFSLYFFCILKKKFWAKNRQNTNVENVCVGKIYSLIIRQNYSSSLSDMIFLMNFS
jgi:hypothetical protein